jgi:hypothetical protein
MDNPEMDSAPKSKSEVPQDNDGKEKPHAPAIPIIKPVARAVVWRDIWDDRFVRFLTSIGIGFWILHELVSDLHLIFLYLAYAFSIADGFFVLGFKLLPSRWWIKSIVVVCYFACLIAVFHFRNDRESNEAVKSDSIAPVLSTDSVRLGDGKNAVQTAFSIYNPSGFPVNGVVLQLHISGDGVRADSVNLKTTDEYLISKDWPPDTPNNYKFFVNTYTYRFDVMQEPTNQNIIFQIGSIRAKSNRYLEISGSKTNVSNATIKITSYSTNSWEIMKTENGTISSFPVSMLPLRAVMFGNPPTNIAVIVNGYTNYPVEQDGKWIHYRAGIY